MSLRLLVIVGPTACGKTRLHGRDMLLKRPPPDGKGEEDSACHQIDNR